MDKLNTSHIYYATSIDSSVEGVKKEYDILYGELNYGMKSLISGEKYYRTEEVANHLTRISPKLDNDKFVTDFVPYIFINPKAQEYMEQSEILTLDKLVIKEVDNNGKIHFFNKNEVQETFSIIKPDAVEHYDKIKKFFDGAGLTIVEEEVRQLDEEILTEHYAHVKDKPFFPEIIEYMTECPVILLRLKGVNAVEKLRTLMGPTDSRLATSGTIRNMFGTDKSRNAIHGSDSNLNAQIELNRFFNEKSKIKTK